jgi:hypothetical protein
MADFFVRRDRMEKSFPFLFTNPLEAMMRKMIALAIAGFVWKKLQSRFLGKSASRTRRGY